MAATPATDTGYWCDECQEIVEAVRVYECSRCSEATDDRRCSECNIFASRRDEDGCENCFAAVEEVEVTHDHDGTLIRAEDYEPNGESLRNREAASEAAAAAARTAKIDAAAASHAASGRTATWADVRPGMRLAARDYEGNIDTIHDTIVLSATTAGPDCAAPLEPGDIVALILHYGVSLERHSPTDETMILGQAPADERQLPVTERFTIEQSPHPLSGSPNYMVEAGMGFDADGRTRLPMGYIHLRSTPYSNMRTNLGTFSDPAEAQAFAATARVAAAHLAPHDGGHFSTQFTDADEPVTSQLTLFAHFTTGEIEFGAGKGLTVRTSSSKRGGMTTMITDQRTMIAVAEAAETIAERLARAIGL